MNKYRVLVEQEYTLRATSEYIVEAKSEEDIEKAIECATKVAGIAVTKKGTSYVNRNEI